MNNTNRGMNRGILLVVGVALIGLGAAVAVAALWPTAGDTWRTSIDAAVSWMQDADRFRIAGGSAVSWFVLAILVVVVLIVVFAAVVISRMGGGRSAVVVRDAAGDGVLGSVTVTDRFASDALGQVLHSREDVLSSRISSRRVRGVDVLHVKVTPRQNTSPQEIADAVTLLTGNLNTLTGHDTPAYVSIHTGMRVRLAADQPRVR